MGVLARALRNVSRRKIRVLLVVIALGFSMAIMISIPAGIVANQVAAESQSEDYREIIASMEEEINKTSTLIECRNSSGQHVSPGMPPGERAFGSRQEVFLDETVGDEIRSIEGVKDVVQFLEKTSEETISETMTGPFGMSFQINRPVYTIRGVSLNSSFIDSYSVLPTNITAGRSLREGDSRVVLMTSNLTDYFGVVEDGKVVIYGESFTVVGIYEPTGEGRTETRMAYMNVSDAQTITDLTGKISRLDVYAENTLDVDGIADVIEAAYPDLSVTTYKDRLENLENMQGNYQTTLETAEASLAHTEATAFQEIVIAIVATSLIVLVTMLYTVRERTKEIGVLKAIGFSNWNVMSQFALEGILMSLMAGIVGLVIGIVAAPALSSLLLPHVNLFSTTGQRPFRQTINPGVFQQQSTTIALDPQTLLLSFGAAVLLGALGSLYPAWKASRTSPMEALRYE